MSGTHAAALVTRAGIDRGSAGVGGARCGRERAVACGHVHEDRGAGVAGGDALIRADLDLIDPGSPGVAHRACRTGQRVESCSPSRRRGSCRCCRCCCQCRRAAAAAAAAAWRYPARSELDSEELFACTARSCALCRTLVASVSACSSSFRLALAALPLVTYCCEADSSIFS